MVGIMRGTTRWIALVLALTLVAAACGGDDDGGTFAGGGGEGDLEAFCDFAQEQEDLDQAVNGGEVNIFEPDEFRAAFEELFDLTGQALDVAPEEIRDDFELVRGELETVRDLLEEADYDLTAVDEAAMEESPEQEAASDRIEAFIEAECGIVDSDEELSDEQLQEQLEESGAGGGLIADAFVAAGLPEDQANCLAERVTFDELLSFSDTAGATPPTEFFEDLDACGVSLEQLTELGAVGGEDLGDMDLGQELGEESVEDLLEDMPGVEPSTDGGELPPEAVDAFVSTLVTQGFTEEEARCLAGPFLEDPANADPLTAFEDCGISLSRLAELGG
jgi:hypothetical protein